MRELLGATGCVVVEGVRGCGKTTTAREFAASEVQLDVDEDARRLAAADPTEVLKGPVPRLIDEWQLEPRIWNHVRRAVDDRRAVGQFILTGSAIPADDATRHTGMRRIVRLRLRPMSLHESGRSSGAISLRRLLAGEAPSAGDHTIPVGDIAELICRGGWPESVDWPLARALRANRSQVDDVARADIRTVDGVRRDPQRVRLRSLRDLEADRDLNALEPPATHLAGDPSFGSVPSAPGCRFRREPSRWTWLRWAPRGLGPRAVEEGARADRGRRDWSSGGTARRR